MELKKFSNDKAILIHITSMIMKSKDPESLVCSESITINKDNFEELKDAELQEAYDDVY